MPVNVWANGPDTPGFVCPDARLTDRNAISWPLRDRANTSQDQDYGQAGWDIGINYTNLHQLAQQVGSLDRPGWVAGTGPIGRGEIRRLAIHSHGLAGMMLVNGRENLRQGLSAASVGVMQADLIAIGLMTPDDRNDPATILFVGCIAGQGPAGSALLIALSKVWPNRKVVGFGNIGHIEAGTMKRAGLDCTEPGMRDTNSRYPGESDRTVGKYWHNQTEWPWASETSRSAKVALNGKIVAGGSN